MKNVLSIIILLAMSLPLFSVTVDGYAYLEGETDHSAIEVFFQRVTPDSMFTNTVYTDSLGYYTSVVEDGWYDVEYSKSGFVSTDTTDVSLYSDLTLTAQTLKPNCIIFTEGEYDFNEDLIVDSLIIEPGAILNFATGTQLIINGFLNAEGTELNKIYFNAQADNWDGIVINTEGFLKHCSINSTRNLAIKFRGDLRELMIYNTDIVTLNNGIEGGGNFYIDSVNIFGNNTGNGIYFQSEMVIRNSSIIGFNNGLYAPAWGQVTTDNTIISSLQNDVFLADGNGQFYNSTFISKQEGIVFWDGVAKIYNCNIYSSIYNTNTSGIYLDSEEGNEVLGTNVYGFDINFNNCGSYIGAIVTTNANSDSCDAYGNISMDPMLDSNFRLQPGSPCIDAGTNTITDYEFPIADLDGNYRIWDGDGNSSVIVDMGTYEFGSPTEIENGELIIDNYTLNQNYPNPFNPETTISYSLINNAQVNLKVYDIAGREVCSLVDQKQNKGMHQVKFDGSRLTSGIYFYRLSVDGKVVSNKKMMLLK
ncbi:MAG: T9SS type A sorting domain-containing protein, partial [Candidatus Delongbacteria bacterium]|nr:T9SS type A sorting domain-containing protein [Candidatus Delongbacteria bacterium]